MNFQLLHQLAETIELAIETEWTLFDRYGETPRTISELFDRMVIFTAVNEVRFQSRNMLTELRD